MDFHGGATHAISHGLPWVSHGPPMGLPWVSRRGPSMGLPWALNGDMHPEISSSFFFFFLVARGYDVVRIIHSAEQRPWRQEYTL